VLSYTKKLLPLWDGACCFQSIAHVANDFAPIYVFSSQTMKAAAVKPDAHHAHEFKYEDISFENKIGEGSYGEVWKGTLWHQAVAVKTLKGIDPEDLKDFENEIALMTTLRHPNIVEFLGACKDQDGNLSMTTEFCPNGSLEDWVQKRWKAGKKLSVRSILNIATDIARGLSWLHHKGVASVAHPVARSCLVLISPACCLLI
jgi:hypothetical protein